MYYYYDYLCKDHVSDLNWIKRTVSFILTPTHYNWRRESKIDRRMASRVDLPSLPPFDPVSDPTSISQRWQRCREAKI